MESTFVTAMHICNVRHLENIDIPLSIDMRKNLILTGKNGSGKTSVLDALARHLNFLVSDDFLTERECTSRLQSAQKDLEKIDIDDSHIRQRDQNKKVIEVYQKKLSNWITGVVADCSSYSTLREKYKAGAFVLAYYRDCRSIEVKTSKNIEKVDLKPVYTISDAPSKELVKYMVNLRATQAFSKDHKRIQQIESWFGRFQNILRRVYSDSTLKLEFNEETFQFTIHIDGREPFDFNTMSMGYAAVFDIISDLMMRMETKAQRNYDLEGIVLVDEIETHLHVELQKKIVPILTELFPNLQFILTTHSPFVLNSAHNAVVYDLENRTLVKDGLAALPYEGIVEGYFGADRLSHELREKFEKYRALVHRDNLTDADFAEASELELYLDEIPDYLALDIATEYRRLKQELTNRG